jgi:hypothetical protein
MKKMLLLLAAAALVLPAAGPATIESHKAPRDFTLAADPADANWNVKGVVFDGDRDGKPVAGHRTEVRSRLTDGNLYLLFICPYDVLHLKPGPVTASETNELWNWDVAEVFIGTNFQHINQYKEFEVSPQGEWVDLDIDRDGPKTQGGWKWNSGFEAKASIDAGKKIWYAAMRIPIKSVDQRRTEEGLEMRVNLFRCQGKDPDRRYLAWQAPHSHSFHTPEAFGILKLAK